MTTHRNLQNLVLAGLVLWPVVAFSQGASTIFYRNLDTVPRLPNGRPLTMQSFLTPFPMDLNEDGVADVIFQGDYNYIKVFAPSNSAVVAGQVGPGALEDWAIALPRDSVIGPNLTSPHYWSSDRPGWWGSLIMASYDVGTQGFFGGLTAYLGVRFQNGVDPHYGWIKLEVDRIAGAANILGYAYELRPGESILAGAVPDPSTIALLAIGAAGIWGLLRKKYRAK